jgi:hypothetical protein
VDKNVYEIFLKSQPPYENTAKEKKRITQKLASPQPRDYIIFLDEFSLSNKLDLLEKQVIMPGPMIEEKTIIKVFHYKSYSSRY